MITTEKKIGRPTARQAGSTTAPQVAADRAVAELLAAGGASTFSAITTDESTSTPIEMAMPRQRHELVWTSATPSRRSTP